MSKTKAKAKVSPPFDVHIAIPRERLQSVLVALYESCYSSWWLGLGEDDADKAFRLRRGLKIADFGKGGKLSDTNYYPKYQLVPFEPDCSVLWKVLDPDNEEEAPVKVWVGRQRIQKGIETLAAKYPRHLAAILTEDDDAWTSDALGQCIVYGDIIFG